MARSYYSTMLDEPAEEVWPAVRDFNGVATWFSSAVSAVRNFVFGDTRIREHLVAMSDVERSYTYEFCDPAPFPVLNYLSTLRVTPVTDGNKALVEWWTTFDCDTSEIDHWSGFFAGEVFKPALEGIRQYLAK